MGTATVDAPRAVGKPQRSLGGGFRVRSAYWPGWSNTADAFSSGGRQIVGLSRVAATLNPEAAEPWPG